MLISTAVSQIVRSPALGWISTLLLSFSPHCAFLVSSGAALAGGLAGAFRFLGLVAEQAGCHCSSQRSHPEHRNVLRATVALHACEPPKLTAALHDRFMQDHRQRHPAYYIGRTSVSLEVCMHCGMGLILQEDISLKGQGMQDFGSTAVPSAIRATCRSIRWVVAYI